MLLYVKALLEDEAIPSKEAESHVRDSAQYAQAPALDDYLQARAFYLLASIFGVSAAQGRRQELFDQFGLGIGPAGMIVVNLPCEKFQDALCGFRRRREERRRLEIRRRREDDFGGHAGGYQPLFYLSPARSSSV